MNVATCTNTRSISRIGADAVKRNRSGGRRREKRIEERGADQQCASSASCIRAGRHTQWRVIAERVTVSRAHLRWHVRVMVSVCHHGSSSTSTKAASGGGTGAATTAVG